MLRRRSILQLLAVAVVVAAASIGLLRHITAAPLVARLLPEADAIVYADLRPLRLATHFDRSAPTRSPEYQQFVDATGIVPERDLDQAAFALTRRPDPAGPNGAVAFSEILAGHFDPARLESFLSAHATTHEIYAGHTIYTVVTGDPASPTPRELRVTLLDHGLLAASNAPTAEQIHAIIDRRRAGPFTSAIPALLTTYFPEIPHLASAWAVGRIGLPFADPANPTGPIALFGLDLPLPADTKFIASLRYLGDLRLRIEALAPSAAVATQQTGALTSLLGLARSLTGGGNAPNVTSPITSILDSVVIAQSGDRTVITATLPLQTLRQLTGTSPGSSPK